MFIKMKRILLYIILSAVALLSCKKEEPAGPAGITGAVHGTVLWNDGTPAANIQVSDGYTVTRTDNSGNYSIAKRNVYSQWVYYTIPADAKIETGANGLPCFYKKLDNSTEKYDFTLTKIPVETKFRILALGDPQVKASNNGVGRFSNETAPDIKAYVASKSGDMPTYAITLGDLVHNEWDLYPQVTEMLSVKNLSVPCFQVIGNHDHEFNSKDPIPDLRSQRKYEAAMGPVNYSFERGDVHFLSVDNIVHQGKNESSCTEELSETVMAWVKADLGAVSKEKTVVVFMHAQLTYANASELFELLAEYADARVVSGHLHYIRNLVEEYKGKKIPNDNAGSTNGVDWCAQVSGGGEPMGYLSYEFEGGIVKNKIYKAVNLPENYQIRLYRPDDFPSFTYTVQNDGGKSYKFGVSGSNKIVANIWNATEDWTFEVWEDGVKVADKLDQMDMKDAWSCWYFYKVLNRNTYSYSRTSSHMYYHTLKNSSAGQIKVVAKDPYGHAFEQTEFTTRAEKDYPAIK